MRFTFWLWALVPTALSGQMLLPLTAWGQEITPDGTLPTQVMQDGDNYTIEGGGRAGGNLFHSFDRFSVPTGGEAFFNNAVDVDNILSRVTGGNVSNIDGLIRANGSANLFMINPAGIVFGPNARLDIGGSFLGSTASGMLFPDGTEFNAANQSTPLLTINAPIGLQFRGNEGNVVNQSFGLEVNPGKNLGLVGGDVSLDGGTITAPGGRVELGGLAAAGTVGLNDYGSLSFPDGVARGNVSFANFAFVDVRAGGGGSITVNARDIEMRGESILLAGIGEDMGAPGSKAGDVTLNATESIIVSESSGVQNRVFNASSTGDSGEINVKAGSLLLSDGGFFSASTLGQGDAGDVNVDVSGPVNLTELSRFSSVVAFGSVGDGGDININAGSVSLSNGAGLNTQVFPAFDELPAGQGNAGSIMISAGSFYLKGGDTSINSSTSGQGNAGNVIIEADGNARLENGSIFSNVETGAVGNVGNIEIRASSVSLIDGSQLQTSVSGNYAPELAGGRGNAGQIIIDVGGGVVEIMGEDANGFPSGILSILGEGGVGQGGNIEITGRSLSLANGVLRTNTFGEGDAGNVNIDVEETVTIEGLSSTIASTVGSAGVGNGGEINIKAGALSMTDDALLITSTAGQGNAGNVNIDVEETVTIEGLSGINTAVISVGVGDGGQINIKAGELSITDDALLGSSTGGQGNAGNVNIDVEETVTIEGSFSGINNTVGSTGVGNGGEINIKAGELSITDDALLTNNTSGEGNAGNVNIDVEGTITIEGLFGGISSTVGLGAVGDGGEINIKAGALSLTGASLSNSTLGQGNSGNVIIDVGSLLLSEGGSVFTQTLGQGNAGNVTINVKETVTIEGLLSGINSTVSFAGVGDGGEINIKAGVISLTEGGSLRASTSGVGDGGNIDITARSLSVTNGARLSAETLGEGDAGSVRVEASEEVRLEEGFILSSVGTEAVGNGGSIDIAARSVSLTDGSQLITQTDSTGKAGDIKINATDSITISGVAPIQEDESGMVTGGSSSGLLASTEENATDSGGTIEVTTGTLRLSDGGVVNARSLSSGEGGNIIVNVDNLSLTGGGQIVTTGFSTGAAGSITVNAAGGRVIASGSDPTFQQRFDRLDVAFENGLTEVRAEFTIDQVEPASGLFAQSLDRNSTGSGDIRIVAESLSLADGAEVTVSNVGTRTGGIIEIKETGNLEVNAREIILNNGTISANTAADQGNINLTTSEKIELRNSSQITANATGAAEGGNITIKTDFLVAFPEGDNDIRANAERGQGGQVNITADGVFGINIRERPNPRTNDITASSESGPQGEVTFNTPNADIIQGLVELSENVVNPNEIVAQACSPNRTGGSSLIETGRGGLPPTPYDPLTDDTIRVGGEVVAAPRLEDLPDPEQIVTKVERTEEITSDDIQPARGWFVNEKGNIVLTPYPTPNATGRHPGARPACGPGSSQK